MISLEREKRIIFKPGVNLHVEVYLSMILLELGFLARITQALIILGGCKDVGVFSELSKDKLIVESYRCGNVSARSIKHTKEKRR